MKESLHNLALVPEDGIGMEVLSRVEPEVQSLFSVTHSIHINIGLDYVGFPSGVAKKLKIEFMVFWTIR